MNVEFNMSLHEKGVDAEYDEPVHVLLTKVAKSLSVNIRKTFGFVHVIVILF